MPNCPDCKLPFVNVVLHIRNCRTRQQNERDALIRREVEQKQQLELKEATIARLQQELEEEKKRVFVMEQPPEMEYYNPLMQITTSYSTFEHFVMLLSEFIRLRSPSLAAIENINTRDGITRQMAQTILNSIKPCHKPIIQKLGQKLGEQKFNGINWNGLINLVSPSETEVRLIKFCDYIGCNPQTAQQIIAKLIPHETTLRAIFTNRQEQLCLKYFICEVCIDKQNLPQPIRQIQ